jgi:hypothetical protein
LNCTATHKSLLLDDVDDGEEGYLPSLLVVVSPPEDDFTIVGIRHVLVVVYK